MSANRNELKIADRIVFWEQQEQINQQLVKRLVTNHNMIQDLTVQNAKYNQLIANQQVMSRQLSEHIKEQNHKSSIVVQELIGVKKSFAALSATHDHAVAKVMSITSAYEKFVNWQSEKNRAFEMEVRELKAQNVLLAAEMVRSRVADRGLEESSLQTQSQRTQQLVKVPADVRRVKVPADVQQVKVPAAVQQIGAGKTSIVSYVALLLSVVSLIAVIAQFSLR